MSRATFATLFFAIPLALADEPKKPDYYPLAKGNKWEYVAESGDMKADVTVVVMDVKTADGKTTATLSVVVDKEEQSVVKVAVDADGVRGCALLNLPADPPAMLLKYPVKPGDSWTEKFKIYNKDNISLSTVKDAEDIKVSAGTFKAVPVVTTLQFGEETAGITNWYADGVGVVQMKLEFGENVATLKLKKFTSGK